MVVYRIVFTKQSQLQIRALHKYISIQSPQNAAKVVADILASLEKTQNNPEFYKPDQFKLNNDSSYRAFEKHNYRISYRIENDIIRVLRVRHTKMNPLSY